MGASRRAGIGWAIASACSTTVPRCSCTPYPPRTTSSNPGVPILVVLDAVVAGLGATQLVGHLKSTPGSRTCRAAAGRRRGRAVRPCSTCPSPTTRSSHQSLEELTSVELDTSWAVNTGRRCSCPGVRRAVRRRPGPAAGSSLHLRPAPRVDGRRAALRGEQGCDPPDDTQPRRRARRSADHRQLREPRTHRHRVGGARARRAGGELDAVRSLGRPRRRRQPRRVPCLRRGRLDHRPDRRLRGRVPAQTPG